MSFFVSSHVFSSPQPVFFLSHMSWTKCPQHNINMRTRQKTKELGVAFRNDGRPLFEQLDMVEEATRKRRVESLPTINEDDEDDQSQSSKKNRSVYSVQQSEDDSPNPKKSPIRLFLQKHDIESSPEYSKEQEQVENLLSHNNNEESSSDSESEDEEDAKLSSQFFTKALSCNHDFHEQSFTEEVQVINVHKCPPFVPHPMLVKQIKFEDTPTQPTSQEKIMTNLAQSAQKEQKQSIQ